MITLIYRRDFYMAQNRKPKDHLITDEGVIKNVKTTQTTVFVVFCRILTAIMAILGIVALVVGNM